MDQSLKRNNVFNEGQLLISARIKRIEPFTNIEQVRVYIYDILETLGAYLGVRLKGLKVRLTFKKPI
jgi:hypothetical protein